MAARPMWRRLLDGLCRPLYWLDERREWFRDASVRRWQRLRERMLEEGARRAKAGEFDAADDVFWLRGDDLRGAVPLRDAVAANKVRRAAAAALDLPLTADRDTLAELVVRAVTRRGEEVGRSVFPGIALFDGEFTGRAVPADDLLVPLAAARADPGLLGPDAVLVAPQLEPAWAVLFPRVGAVVAAAGGELSHASILLREARKPALVNAAGVFRAVRAGDRLRLDGRRGVVEILRG
jgi:pyruvate,water dikinase